MPQLTIVGNGSYTYKLMKLAVTRASNRDPKAFSPIRLKLVYLASRVGLGPVVFVRSSSSHHAGR